MAAANVYAQLSYCTRRQVGAVIEKNGSLISFGYNGMPSGEPNVCELADGSTNPRVRHAEINALRKLMRSHESAVGSAMFVTDSCCPNCAIEVAESGVAAVFYDIEYSDVSGIEHLLNKEVKVFRVDTVNRQIFECDRFHLTRGVLVDEDGVHF